MIRARFTIATDDYRPVSWPIAHPYWCTGYGTDNADNETAVIVAYGPDEAYFRALWPEITTFDFWQEVNDYVFSDRFPKPTWFEEPS